MHTRWREILTNAGAEWDGDFVASFGNIERETRMALSGDILVDLGHTTVIVLQGDDAVQFLQGQTTNDVKQVTQTQSQLGAFCNQKGRVICTYRLARNANEYLLFVPSAIAETLLKRLRLYVMRSKVKLENAYERLIGLGVSGPHADKLIIGLGGSIPSDENACTHNNRFMVIRVSGNLPRFEIYASPDALMALWHPLTVHAAPAGTPVWNLLNIQAGLPEIAVENSEEYVPHVLNMHLYNAISFTKGCYTGQEVVARMQYLGKSKKQLVRAHIRATTAPKPNDKLYNGTIIATETQQSCGTIVNSARTIEADYEVLAIVDIGSRAANDVHLLSSSGPLLRFEPIKYLAESG